MHRLIEDLRFFIGAFFLIVGVLLLLQGLLVTGAAPGPNLNLLTGIAFTLFASGSLYLSLRANRRD